MEIYVTRDNHWVDVSQKSIKGGGELSEEFRRDWARAVDRYDDARRLTRFEARSNTLVCGCARADRHPVMQAGRPSAGSYTERRDRTETSVDMARASTDRLGEMVELYPHPSCLWLLGRQRRWWLQS